MPTPTLAELIKRVTKDDILGTFVAFLKLVGFPVASWDPFSDIRGAVEGESAALEDLGLTTSQIAAASSIRLAARAGLHGWVDIIAEGFFEEVRKPALFTRGTVTFTDAAGVGPVPITPGQTWVQTQDRTLRFKVVSAEGPNIPLNGELTATVEAEFAGSAYNVPVSTITELVTSIAGVTVSNPGDPLTGTWITTQGTDAETSIALGDRCVAKWATQGSGSTEDAYKYWVLTAHPEVTRFKMIKPGDGQVIALFGGVSGPVSAAAAAAVQTVLTAKKPIASRVIGQNSILNSTAVVGTLYVRTGASLDAAKAAAQTAVQALAREQDLGPSTVYRHAIVEALMSPADVYNLVLSNPPADVALAQFEQWVPTFTLNAVYS